MRYFIQTMGCQMNVHDSRRMEEVLRASGYEEAEAVEDADLIVFNTCSIREKAEHKLMSALGKVRPEKESRPGVTIAVAGCVAQQEGDRLLKKARFIDLVVGPDNIAELPRLVEEAQAGAPPCARTEFDLGAPAFLEATPDPTRLEVAAFVTVMKGCDERCTYCVVPNTRGPERYRPADEIIHEVRTMAQGGVREVTLLGQTVNSWFEPGPDDRGEDDDGGRGAVPSWSGRLARTSRFGSLLRRIAEEVPELDRLRYTSPHPRHLTDSLIEAHRDLPVLARHLHLPVQSGSDRVLKRMLRRYTRELYLERVGRLKATVPGLTLSTDIIVGFPGETDAEFEDTLSLLREAGFVSVFAFTYSPRPHTPSLRLADDVPGSLKSERLQAVFETVGKTQRAHLRSLVGSQARVLIEGRSKKGERWAGRSERNEIVHVAAPSGIELAGALLTVEIEHANEHSLAGKPVGPLPARAKRSGPRRLQVLPSGAA